MVWAQDPLERMRLMAVLTDSVGGLRGGALASAVHAHVRHGASHGELNKFTWFIYYILYGLYLDMCACCPPVAVQHGKGTNGGDWRLVYPVHAPSQHWH